MRKRSLKTRRLSGSSSSADDVNLTPLIDMVFILLIFFLVTASYIRESSVSIQRPKAATALQQQGGEVTVVIDAEERIWLNNVALDIRLLRDRLVDIGLASPSRTAVILADAQTSTGLLIKVMDQLRLAGFQDISVAASSDADG